MMRFLALACSWIFFCAQAFADPVFVRCDDMIYRIDSAERSIRAFDEEGRYFKDDICQLRFGFVEDPCEFTDVKYEFSLYLDGTVMVFSIFRNTGKARMLRARMGEGMDEKIYNCERTTDPAALGLQQLY